MRVLKMCTNQMSINNLFTTAARTLPYDVVILFLLLARCVPNVYEEEYTTSMYCIAIDNQ